MKPYNFKTIEGLSSAIDALELIGRTIVHLDTRGVICSFTPKNKKTANGEYGITTDGSIIVELEGERVFSIYASSFKDIYEGFDITISPKPSLYERNNKMKVAEYFRDCYHKKIIDYEIKNYSKDIIDCYENVTSDSPSALILKLEDGSKLIFSNPILDGYMDLIVELSRQ